MAKSCKLVKEQEPFCFNYPLSPAEKQQKLLFENNQLLFKVKKYALPMSMP